MRIKFRRGTAAEFTAANPVLGQGEPAYETDTKKIKTGDGVAAWTSLPYRDQWRQNTAANWTSENPVLLNGEPAYETDTGKVKIGNGGDSWVDLAYFGEGGGIVGPDDIAGITLTDQEEDSDIPSGDITLAGPEDEVWPICIRTAASAAELIINGVDVGRGGVCRTGDVISCTVRSAGSDTTESHADIYIANKTFRFSVTTGVAPIPPALVSAQWVSGWTGIPGGPYTGVLLTFDQNIGSFNYPGLCSWSYNHAGTHKSGNGFDTAYSGTSYPYLLLNSTAAGSAGSNPTNTFSFTNGTFIQSVATSLYPADHANQAFTP
jgi:hypothetical protein